MIESADIGNANTKNGSGIVFASKVCKRLDVINQRNSDDRNLLEYDGKKYLIGEGELQTDTNKMDKENYILCLLTALARSSATENNFKVVVGIPGNQYNEQNVNRLKNDILANRVYNFKLAGTERNIIIEDVAACSEVVGAYNGMTADQKAEIRHNNLILVNIGGGNVNIGYFKQSREGRKLEQSSTLMKGTTHLFADIVDAVNGRFATNFDIEEAENILARGVSIYGEQQELTFLKSIILDHADWIFKELNLYPIKTSKVMFTGGGSKTLKSILKQRLTGCLFQTNYLTAGAQGFKKVGERLWQEA